MTAANGYISPFDFRGSKVGHPNCQPNYRDWVAIGGIATYLPSGLLMPANESLHFLQANSAILVGRSAGPAAHAHEAREGSCEDLKG